ncbi:MAG: hypothetical protein ABSG62_10340 [Terracidiphilus sp.]|jgi:hypothetical protein
MTESRKNVRKSALDKIRASIIAERGSLEGILDEFLAERREEARREWLKYELDGKSSEDAE